MHRRHFLVLAAAGSITRATAATPTPRSLFIEDLTWIEVRDAVHAGAFIAIVPTGGTEENGPHMATGKHNLIVRHCAGEIARRLGNALVAPVIAYVPEGSFDPPGGNMSLPGTIGVTEPTFAAILTDAATSLALSGFTLICFIGDHGLSQRMQAAVASTLTQQWRGRGVRVADIDRYYGANGQEEWLKSQGFSDEEIGQHAGLVDTAELMAVAPQDIRADLLQPRSWPPGNSGVEGDPTRATAAIGRTLIELKIAAAVAQIKSVE